MFDVRDARLLVAGVALTVGAVALSLLGGRGPVAPIAGAMGIGLLVVSGVFTRSPRVRLTTLAVVFVGFAVSSGVALLRGTLSAHRTVACLVAVSIVAVAFVLVREHVRGAEQLARLFERDDAGYAPVLNERTAARTVEAELARSRRHDIPLTFLVLRPVDEPRPAAVEAVAERLSGRALAELGLRYYRSRTCALIAERVRRSDVVICSADDHFLVIASDTTAEGTSVVAERIIEAVRAERDVELRSGVAAFPSDGSTYSELILSAFAGVADVETANDARLPLPSAGADADLDAGATVTPAPAVPPMTQLRASP